MGKKVTKATKKYLSSNNKRKDKPKFVKRKKEPKDEATLVEDSQSDDNESDLGFAESELEIHGTEKDEDIESEEEAIDEEMDSEGEYEIDNDDEEFSQFDRKPEELLLIIKRAKSGSFTALRQIWKELRRVANLETKENEDLIIYASFAYLSTTKIGVKQYKSSCKQFLAASFSLLKRRSETVLKYFEHIVPILMEFKKVRKDYLKLLVSIWCNDADQIRIKAFLAIRRMAMTETNVLEEALKIMYNAMVQFKVNAYNYVIAQFMVNCMVEIAGLSLVVTYNHMFVSLRKLAILLRLVTAGKEFTNIYNWQVIFALRMWAQVITTFTEEDTLKPLVYPLVQIMVGIIRHKPGVRYLPFKLSIIRLLINITSSSKTFIPLTSYLLEIFNMNELKQDGKPSTLKPLDLNLNIKIPNQYLGTKSLQQSISDEVNHLLWEYFSAMSNSIAFPELVVPSIIHFKKLLKQDKSILTKPLPQLIEKLEENATFIDNLRSNVKFGPKDIEKALDFENEIQKDTCPIYKFNQRRLKVKGKAPKEEAASFVEDVEGETNKRESTTKELKKMVKKFKANENLGDDDVVEDFELWDE